MNTAVPWFDTELEEPAPGACPAGVDAWGVAAVPLLVESDRAMAIEVVVSLGATSTLEAAGAAEDEMVKTPPDELAAVNGLPEVGVLAAAAAVEPDPELLDEPPRLTTVKSTLLILRPPRLIWIGPGFCPTWLRFGGRTRTIW